MWISKPVKAIFPDGPTLAAALAGLEQLTGRAVGKPVTDTVGCPAAVLHSMNPPGEGAFLGKPAPSIPTSVPWAKPVSGLTVIEGPDEAEAASAVPLRAAPTMRAATPMGPTRLAVLVIHRPVAVLLRPTFPPASVRRSVEETSASVTLRHSPRLAHPHRRRSSVVRLSTRRQGSWALVDPDGRWPIRRERQRVRAGPWR